MTPLDFSNAYAAVAKAHGLPALAPARCRIQTRLLGDPENALTELQGHEPQQGWLQFQSHVVVFVAGDPPQPSSDWGLLLAAETVDASGRSIHLRQTGAGGWVLVVCSPLNGAAGAGADDLVLADQVTQLATGKAPGPLRYRRYWRLDPDIGATPAFAAFIGFDRTEDY